MLINRQYLPEPFLWDTFYHLVEAAVAMRNGPKDGDWDFNIVHRDLKPGNSKTFQNFASSRILEHPFTKALLLVFLGKENAEKGYPFYPVAKLGDYGIAVMTNDNDPYNPHAYRGPGTPGYYAPVITTR